VLHDLSLRHAETDALLYCDSIPLDLGWSIHIMKAMVPKILPFRELTQVGELVRQIEVQIQRVASAVVIFYEDDCGDLDIDVHIAFSGLDPHTGSIHQRAQWNSSRFNAARHRALLKPRQKETVRMLAEAQRSDDNCIFRQFQHYSRIVPDFVRHIHKFFLLKCRKVTDKVPIMAISKSDWDILKRFKFEARPVSVKFLTKPLRGTAKLDKNLSLCEMLKAAFEGNSFYAAGKNHTCEPGLHVLGQTELARQYLNGEFGAGMRVFRDERAAGRLYHYIPKIAKGAVRYVAFSPFDQPAFDPDVLIILADTEQTEILLRAMSYGTGEMWQSCYSSAIGCAWLFVYPYLTGKINFVSTGLGFGIKRRKLFPEGRQLISIPFDRLSYMLHTLQEMPWIPRPYQPDGLEYVKQLRIRLGLNRS
jgi:uncharacterized protein (DUF169 family)